MAAVRLVRAGAAAPPPGPDAGDSAKTKREVRAGAMYKNDNDNENDNDDNDKTKRDVRPRACARLPARCRAMPPARPRLMPSQQRECVEMKGARAKWRGNRAQGPAARPQFHVSGLGNAWWGKPSLVCRERDPNDCTTVPDYHP